MSLLFLLFYVILIASMQFPFVARESGVDLNSLHGTPFAWGFVFAVGLLVSVFLHEFGHILMAQRLGIQARSITLMMLGGMSQLDRMPEKPSGELKIAVIGPLVSFVIAIGLSTLTSMTRSADIGLFSYWLSRANLALGVFNLLPAFPTDGGRVLRSLLAARQGKIKGTRNAVRVSQVFAWIFGAIGFLQFNVILILIALFIYSGAKSELAAMLARSLLRGLRASDVGKRLNAIPDDLDLEEAADVMVSTRSFILPIRTGSQELAVVTAEQIKRVPQDRWSEVMVRDVMSAAIEGVEIDTPLESVLEHGLVSAMGGAPLTEQGRVVGVLRNTDLAEVIELRSLERGHLDELEAA